MYVVVFAGTANFRIKYAIKMPTIIAMGHILMTDWEKIHALPESETEHQWS
jgi:hypothetical protein